MAVTVIIIIIIIIIIIKCFVNSCVVLTACHSLTPVFTNYICSRLTAGSVDMC